VSKTLAGEGSVTALLYSVVTALLESLIVLSVQCARVQQCYFPVKYKLSQNSISPYLSTLFFPFDSSSHMAHPIITPVTWDIDLAFHLKSRKTPLGRRILNTR